MASYQSYPLLQNVKLTPAPGSIVGGVPGRPGSLVLPAPHPAPSAAPAGTGQLTPAQIQQQIGHYVSTLPTAMTPGQISTQAQNEIAPQIGALSKALQSQVANASTAINGYTQDLAAKLGAVNYGAPYAQAESQQAAVDSALSQALAGGGTQNAQDLQARLAQIQEPGATGQAANAVQANATGNSNTVLGAGSSNLGQLIANAASANAYGAQLPGIARAAGGQQLANVQGNANQALADGTQKIQAELPGILDNLRSSADTNRSNRAQLGEHVFEFLTGQNTSNAQNAQTAATAKAAAAADDVHTKITAILGAGIDPATGQLTPQAAAALTQLVGVAGLTGANSAAPVAKPVAPRSVSAGSTLVDPTTGKVIYQAPPKPAVVKPAKPGAGTAATGGLSASSWRTLVSQATTSVADGLKTKPQSEHYDSTTGKFIPVPGTGSAATPYQTKLAEVLAMGPSTPAWQKKAKMVVDAQYPQGQNGRPYEGAEAVTVARQFVTEAMKHGLTQEQALARGRATGVIPDGALVPVVTKAYRADAKRLNRALTAPLTPPAASTGTAKSGGVWTASTDPIVGPGPSGTGTHRTKSGRLVNEIGAYVG